MADEQKPMHTLYVRCNPSSVDTVVQGVRETFAGHGIEWRYRPHDYLPTITTLIVRYAGTVEGLEAQLSKLPHVNGVSVASGVRALPAGENHKV